MNALRILAARLRGLFGLGRRDEDLQQEIDAHLGMLADEHERRGLSADEARWAARRAFGGVDQVTEAYRDQRGVRVLDALAQDVRYGARTLRRSPGFTIVAVLSLALGIGLNTAMFTIVQSVLLRPLPYEDPARLMMVYSVSERGPFKYRDGPFADAHYVDLTKTRSMTHLAAFDSFLTTMTGVGEPLRIPRGAITPNLLLLLGLGEQASLGRGFRDDDGHAGAARVALMSDRLWRTHFAADPGIVGRLIQLDGQPHTVVGVMPPGFGFPNGLKGLDNRDVWTPLVIDPGYRANASHRIVGRLVPGVTPAQARSELLGILMHTSQNRVDDLRVVGLQESIVGDAPLLLFVFFGAVALVLLVACANVANLMIARGTARTKEMALRGALGASRLRLVQQLLTESALLALAGGALGFLVCRGSLTLLLRFLPENKLPRIEEIAGIGVDPTVLAFMLLACVFTALVVGAAPALTGAARNLNNPLQEGAGRATARGVMRVRGALVMAEIALVLVLLTGAGLLLKSFWLLRRVEPGFSTDRVLTMQIALPEHVYRTVADRKAFHQQLLERMQSLPGAADAGLINLLPFGEMGWMGDFEVEDAPTPPVSMLAGKPAVSSDYFRALRIPLVRGRYFTDADRDGAPRVVIVSDLVARQYWPGKDPIGKRLTMDSKDNAWLTVVGVVADIRQATLAGDPQPMVYVPYQQEWRGFFLANMAFFVRVTGERKIVADGMKQLVHAIDRDLPVQAVAPLDELLSRSVAEPRFRTSLLMTFAALGLLLACVGIYGIVAYDVATRTREIGIRVALGARPNAVIGTVMARSLALVGAGLLVGLAGSLALTRLLDTFLFVVDPHDPATLVTVSLFVIGAACAAAFIPARRALRIEPVTALRSE